MNSVVRQPSLIVTTSHNPTALALVLEGVSLQTRQPSEVLIADDGSGDETTAVVTYWTRRLGMPVRRFWQPPRGFRKTIILNRTVRAATGDYLIFLDGDCLPERHFIADHLKHAAPGIFVQGRRAGVREPHSYRVAPKHFHPVWMYLRGQLYGLRRGIRRPWPRIQIGDLTFVQGCNFGVWRDDFFGVNGFDETFSGWGHEDTELAERLANSGRTCKVVTGQAIVYHLDHPRVSRSQAGNNAVLLERTKRERRVWCEQGLAPHDAARRS